MKNKLALNTFRSIKKAPGRFIAIMMIICIGCAFFSGVKATCPDMLTSAWKYNSDHALADVHIKSTLGFNDDDAEFLMSTGSFDKAYSGYSADVFVKGDNGDTAISLLSYSAQSKLNILTVTEGRLPEKSGECVADSAPKEGISFSVGDKVKVYTNSDDGLDDVLETDEFTVVGLVTSPLYISNDRGSTTIGNGTLNAFIYIPEEDFAYDIYTDIFLTVRGADDDSVEPFSEKYESVVEAAELVAEKHSEERLDIRRGVIRDEAKDEIDDARKKLADAEDEYNDGLRKYNDGLKEYEDACDEFENGKADYDQGYADYENGMEEIAKAEDTCKELEYTCTEIDNFLNAHKDRFVKTIPPEMLDAIRTYQDIYDRNHIEAQITELLAVYLFTDPLKDPVTKQATYEAIYGLNEQVRAAAAGIRYTVDTQKKALEDGKKLLDENAETITEGEAELEKAKRELDDAKKELDDGEVKIADARQELADAEADLEEMLSDGEWLVWNRSEFTPDCYSYGEDAERIDAIADVFPIFFIIIAALVCCTTMSRMVEEERTQAGTFKSLGFSSASIVMQYVLYAAAASVIGCAVGTVLGFRFIPPIIFNAYKTMYTYPDFRAPFMPMFALGCLIVSLLSTCLAAMFTAVSELRLMPAQLIRPKAPKEGKRILLERITFIWKRMSFSHKVTFRNLFRYKSRLFMTIFGIAGCTALLLTGFGLKYAISSIVDKQYEEISLYDAIAAVDSEADADERVQIESFLSENTLVSGSLKAIQESVNAVSDNGEFECYILATDDIAGIDNFIKIKDRKTGQRISIFPDSVVINEKLARLLGVSAGGYVTVEGSKTMKISAVCENYAGNYIYMTEQMYNSVFEDNQYNTVFLDLGGVSEGKEYNEFATELIEKDGVLTVISVNSGADTFRKLIDSLNVIIIVIIGFAGALAFVILFNLANINVNERMRELATIKVLGFYDGEVGAYVYRENVISTIMAIAVGLVLGIFMESFVIHTAEVDAVMFSPDIPLYCFVYAAVVTIAFSLLVNFIMYFRLKKIDMAASMKAIE